MYNCVNILNYIVLLVYSLKLVLQYYILFIIVSYLIWNLVIQIIPVSKEKNDFYHPMYNQWRPYNFLVLAMVDIQVGNLRCLPARK